MFKELTGRAPMETVRAIRLTNSAKSLRDSGACIVDAAFDSGFLSHDGFTRAFHRRFGMTPLRYKLETPPAAFFIHHPIEAYFILKEGTTAMQKENVSRTVTVTTVERPARKLIFLRVPTAADYFTACEEVGCDWEGYYNSIAEKFDTAAGGRLPDALIKPGTGGLGFYVEVPADYDKPLLDGYETAALPPCTYLYFNGMPFENPNDFPVAIGILNEAIRYYPYERFGWKRSSAAPELGMGAETETGARFAVPVERM
jgi:hypothetical protein